MSERTFTADEIKRHALEWDGGCTPEKVRWLEELGITVEHDANRNYQATITVEFRLDAREFNDDRGCEEFDALGISDIECALDDYLSDSLGDMRGFYDITVDARVHQT